MKRQNLDYIATDGLAPDTKPLSYVLSHLGGGSQVAANNHDKNLVPVVMMLISAKQISMVARN